MEGFFSGLIIVFYLISRYASEYLFVAACLFPVLLSMIFSFMLHFGAQGRIVAAYKRSKRFLVNGVIAAGEREVFRKTCLKGTPAPLRFAFHAFASGEITSYEFCEKTKESAKDRRAYCFGVYYGLTAALSVLTFLSFYFACPLDEAFLRFAISIFFLSINGAILHFMTFGYMRASENAAVGLSALLEKKLLRVAAKDEARYPALRYLGSKKEIRKDAPTGDRTAKERAEKKEGEPIREKDTIETDFDSCGATDGVERLRELLRKLDAPIG